MVRYPFSRCLARPQDEKGSDYFLAEHIQAVASAMGRPDGERQERICFLAGLLHDAGKACSPWQDYVRASSQGKRPRGVPHSFAGAMLFALLLKELLDSWKVSGAEKEALLDTGLALVYLIYHHHGPVPNLMGDYPPWFGEYDWDNLQSIDLNGLLDLVGEHFPELLPLKQGLPGNLEEKMESVALAWRRWRDAALDYTEDFLTRGNLFAKSAELVLLRNWNFHRLIAGDRLHAAGLDPLAISPNERIAAEEAGKALDKIASFCSARQEKFLGEGAQNNLLEKREGCRQAALAGISRHEKARLYTLELPTGYGKTLTALSAALSFVHKGLCQRIIYVAPYLSILAQAADEIADATGLEVLTHHHLAALENIPESGTSAAPEEETAVDTWMAPVVVTTYNQFFKALFPRRCQHTMRLKGLHNSIVIVDEPQIISPNSWVPFLAMVEAAAQQLDCRFLFTTATLPEMESGLFALEPVSLGQEDPLFSRYKVISLGSMDEISLAEAVVKTYREEGTAAVILNTIQDAALLYEQVQSSLKKEEKDRLYFLSGRLTPLHKQARLKAIKEAMDRKEPVLVISTQVLEAGVDLSFQVLFRALPILPSLIQAAGRCNRHGESALGKVYVFDFLREGDKDTRRYVYRNPDQREVTDAILGNTSEFNESETTAMIREYYRECRRRNPHQAALCKLEAAANGHWEELAGLEPMGDDIPSGGIFVPEVHGELTEIVQRGFNYFGVDNPETLWEKYAGGFINSLNYTDRRRFMTLLYQFMVTVPLPVAAEVGEPVPNRALLRLRYPSLYRSDVGLSLVVSSTAPLAEQFM